MTKTHIYPELNPQSFFPIDKGKFLIAFLGFALLQISLLFGGSKKLGLDDSTVVNMRLAIFIVGPVITFLGLFAYLNFVFYDESHRPTFKLIFEFSLIGGLISILLALTLNSRAVLIQLAAYFTIGEDFAIFLGPAIVAPMVEEMAKGLPIYYLSRGLITRPNEDSEYRVFQNIKTPVYVGAITGLMFNCLETYWYLWNTGYLFDISDDELWHFVVLQVIIRSTNLLHIFTASIIGLGVALSLYSTPNKVLNRREYRFGIFAYLVAFGIHAIWNGSLVLADENTPSIRVLGEDFPIFNLNLLLFSLIGLFILWTYLRNYESKLCEFCKEWHIEPYDEETHFQFTEISEGIYNRIKNGIFKTRTIYSCPSCRIKIGAGQCLNCQPSTSFNCANCSVAVPAHASACWNCGFQIEAPFIDVMIFPQSDSSIFARPVVYILTGFYLSASISILIVISRSISDGSNDVIPINDQLMVIYLFLFMIGLAFLRVVRWLNDPFSYSLGYSMARTIFSMLIFQFAMLFIALGLIFLGIPEFVFTGILFLLESVIILHYGFSIMFNFSPLFHQVEDERLVQ